MKGNIYLGLTLLGLLIFVITFAMAGQLSEQQLIDRVLFWYVPFVFGLHGLAAYRIATTMPPEQKSAATYFFNSGDAQLRIVSKVLVVLSGFLGIGLTLIPLSAFRPTAKGYELKIAATATFLWLLVLFFFFIAIWPSL